MDLPKTFSELAIWSLMQFPVLAVTAAIAWWVNANARRYYKELIQEVKEAHAARLAEKDLRVNDRDRRVAELQAEVAELKAKLSRPKRSTGGGG